MDTEEEEDDVDELDLEEEESRTKRVVSPDVRKTQIKWNKEGYDKGSRGRHQKSTSELEREVSIGGVRVKLHE